MSKSECFQNGRFLYSLAFFMLFSCFAAFAQTTISGTVKDAGGLVMPGVSIKVKGSQNLTVTDDNGKFSLKADARYKWFILAYLS
ncbi:carboxypeptidase-like regulatory domain-containing protein [Pedobacter jamesrossensis]|uniref:Carboxypeptidase-like regulatory domain-containing protein n=1 Tax=Pedobacter jamesrossensis TaxID=1908238 RepID=A0ABV8NLX4_9SPHI